LTKGGIQPGVVGVALSLVWSDIQPSATTYSWSAVDARLAEAKTLGLNVALTLSDSPLNAPTWLTSNPAVQKITIGTVTAPVFWDPIFQADRLAMIQAVGARYASNPLVVAVNTSFANWSTDDWSVPHANGQWQAWLSAGWTTAGMLAIGEAILTTTATAFPSQSLKLAIGTTDAHLDSTITTLASDITTYGYATYPGRYFAQINWLTTQTATATSSTVQNATPDEHDYLLWILAQHLGQVGAQELAGATNGPSDGYLENGGTAGSALTVLTNAVNLAQTYLPEYVEVWQSDGTNPTLSGELQAATTSMKAY
jgi:hypothetical protein